MPLHQAVTCLQYRARPSDARQWTGNCNTCTHPNRNTWCRRHPRARIAEWLCKKPGPKNCDESQVRPARGRKVRGARMVQPRRPAQEPARQPAPLGGLRLERLRTATPARTAQQRWPAPAAVLAGSAARLQPQRAQS